MKKNPYRNILIYLHIVFEGDQTKIMKELLENNLKPNYDGIEEYLKENKIDRKKYRTIADKRYPKKYIQDLAHPTLVVEK